MALLQFPDFLRVASANFGLDNRVLFCGGGVVGVSLRVLSVLSLESLR